MAAPVSHAPALVLPGRLGLTSTACALVPGHTETWPGVPGPSAVRLVRPYRGPWAVGRAARLVRPGGRNLARDPWAVGRDPWPVDLVAVDLVRAGRAARPGACYLVRDPWPVDLVPGAVARATWCAPWWPGPGAGGESRRAIGAVAVDREPGAAFRGPCAKREGLGPISHSQLRSKQF
jgi:hypothetical protein